MNGSVEDRSFYFSVVDRIQEIRWFISSGFSSKGSQIWSQFSSKSLVHGTNNYFKHIAEIISSVLNFRRHDFRVIALDCVWELGVAEQFFQIFSFIIHLWMWGEASNQQTMVLKITRRHPFYYTFTQQMLLYVGGYSFA